jgi:hypothetical protein
MGEKIKSDEELLHDFVDWISVIHECDGSQFAGGSQMIEACNKVRDEILARMKK